MSASIRKGHLGVVASLVPGPVLPVRAERVVDVRGLDFQDDAFAPFETFGVLSRVRLGVADRGPQVNARWVDLVFAEVTFAS